MTRTLMPHQKEALEYASRTQHPAFYMEMRLGKTLVAIRWLISTTDSRRRVLIVAPLAVLPTWQYELGLEGYASCTVTGDLKHREAMVFPSKSGIWLINYERLLATPSLATLPWSSIVVDESTRIRTPQAKITKMLTRGFRSVPSRAILSGLPAPESPLDYFSQFQFLHGKFCGFQNYWHFRKTLFNLYGFNWVPRGRTVEQIKTEIHKLAFIRTRRNVGIGSKKIYEKRYVYMNPEQKRLYKKIETEFATDFTETKWNVTKLLWMARVAGGFEPDTLKTLSDLKTKEIYTLLTSELKDESVVIWFRFNSELLHVSNYLRTKGIRSYAIYGTVPTNDRNIFIQKFKTGEVQVLCVQIKCGKFGVDWSNASTAIYYSNSYEAEERAQSEDRIVHPKKKEPLLYIDLVTKDTVDEDVIQTLKEKNINSKVFMMRLLSNWRDRKCV